ncbi:hypothetical protein ASC68_20155 [Devosia sp. Root105]|nr:hypothetical protein ASC68_20155 [Devosia sp. Root105]
MEYAPETAMEQQMARSTTERIGAIRTWSRRFGVGLLLVIIALPVGTLAALLASRLFGGDVYIGPPDPVDLSTVSLGSAVLIGTGALLSVGLYLVPLYFLRQLFGLWAAGQILTRGAASAIRRAGIALLVATAGSSVIGPLTDLMANELGRFSISIDLANLLPAGVIYVVGLVLDEAARVAEDAKLTI